MLPEELLLAEEVGMMHGCSTLQHTGTRSMSEQIESTLPVSKAANLAYNHPTAMSCMDFMYLVKHTEAQRRLQPSVWYSHYLRV